MANEIKLPNVGENVASAKIVRVLVHEGDAVKKEQPVVEIETEKATLEVPSESDGTVGRILVHEGDEIQVGQTIMTLDGGAGGAATEDKGKVEPAPAAAAASPAAKEAQAEAEQVGTGPEKPRDPAEAAAAGEAERQRDDEHKAQVAQPEATAKFEAASAPSSPDDRPLAPASPSVRRFAREIGIEISQVEGTGSYGRITAEDVKAYARRAASGQGPAAPARPAAGGGPAPQPLPDFAKWGEVEAQDLSNIRRVIAQRLSYSWQTVAHVHHQDVADITQLEALRQQRNEQAGKDGVKLTVTAVALKVLARALSKYPAMNSSIDMASGKLILKRYIHIGVAVDTPRGLLVPVIRDVDKKSILDLAAELTAVSKKARDGKLGPDEMKGGTFTITNLGGIGGTQFNPIVNWPEVGILGLSRARKEYVMHEGRPQWRLMLPLCLGYDHRVIDGADGARFARDVAAALSNPLNLLLEI